jgi:hypothetical protein
MREDAKMRSLLSPVLVVLVAANAWAGAGTRGFSNADVTGNYNWLAQGSAVVPNTPIAFPVVIIGTVFSDGQGTMQGTATVNLSRPGSGLTPGQPVALALTYEVAEDGTGQWFAAVNPNEPPSLLGSGAMVIGAHDEVYIVSTQPGRVLSTTAKKQKPPSGGFSNATLGGAWALTCHGALVTATEDALTPEIVPVAVIGLMTNDGDGTFSAAVTVNINGDVTPEAYTGETRVNSDGLVTATATSTEPVLLANLSGVVDNRHEFRAISTDPGRIVSCAFTAQERPDEDRDQRRRHAR